MQLNLLWHLTLDKDATQRCFPGEDVVLHVILKGFQIDSHDPKLNDGLVLLAAQEDLTSVKTLVNPGGKYLNAHMASMKGFNRRRHMIIVRKQLTVWLGERRRFCLLEDPQIRHVVVKQEAQGIQLDQWLLSAK